MGGPAPDVLAQWLQTLLADALRSPQVQEQLRSLLRRELDATSKEPPSATGDRMMTVAEAASYAGVAESTIRDWIGKGKLRALQAGNGFRIKRSELEACMTVPAGRVPALDLDQEASQIINLCRQRKRSE